jgi:hypothetical protein
MTEEGLKRVEGGLAITLPAALRGFLSERGAELRKMNQEDPCNMPKQINASANDLLILNCEERRPSSALSDAYPKWWETYVLLGEDGAGGCYCVWLNGRPGVWMIGSDDDGEPTQQFESVEAYADHFLELARKKKPKGGRKPRR